MKSVEPIKPGLLLAGRNAVTTDAIAAAAMGYNPQAAHREFPFPGDNHLLLLSQVGVGAIDPQRIEVRGVPLAKALCPYNPKRIPLNCRPPGTTFRRVIRSSTRGAPALAKLPIMTLGNSSLLAARPMRYNRR